MTLDHLVVLCATLEQGARWCEESLGVSPAPGGRHLHMGTHNRLLSVRSDAHPQAYLELIALDPQAEPGVPVPGQSRWFDLDREALLADVAAKGPQLIHWVVGVSDIEAAVQRLAALGIDRGPALPASRQTPQGLLQWRITVRPDGQRLFDGALPTLIQWTPPEAQPAQHLPASSVQLLSIQAWHPNAQALQQAWAAIPEGAPPSALCSVQEGAPRLLAVLDTPRGRVVLDSTRSAVSALTPAGGAC